MLNLIKKKVDIIIIGAVLSGLTLANKISEKSKKSILLIEKKKNREKSEKSSKTQKTQKN